ncbi:MAG: hypothetical protein JWQ94_557 [Tardiphaga sp.]|nr:hypothetical protein [Tardiphaga sp.]
MTHRPIAPISIEGLTPGGTPRALPIFEWVDPGTLLVDAGYQRDLSRRSLALIRRIVAGWDWARFKAPIGVLTDAGIELIDGQCTSIAAATHPAVEKIPVMIVEAAERSDRATAFIGHNRDRVAVTPTQIHVAALVGGDGAALAIDRVCAASGAAILSVPSKTTYKPGETLAVTAIAALVRGRGEGGATAVLSCLVAAGCAPMTQLHIKAADLLLHTDEYSREIDPERLSLVITSMGPKVDQEAKVFVAAHPSTPLWKAMAICWFKARRATKATSIGTEKINTAPEVAKLQNNATGGGLKTEGSSDKSLENTITSRNDLIGTRDLKTASGKLMENITHRSPVVTPARQSNRDDSCKRDSRPKLSGWIPGPVLRRCSGCDEKYTGDVKSKSCADCAYGCREAVSA